MAEAFVDVHEVNRATGLPPSYWYALAERQAVPSYKIGKYRRFKLSEIHAWLEGHREGPGTEAKSAASR